MNDSTRLFLFAVMGLTAVALFLRIVLRWWRKRRTASPSAVMAPVERSAEAAANTGLSEAVPPDADQPSVHAAAEVDEVATAGVHATSANVEPPDGSTESAPFEPQSVEEEVYRPALQTRATPVRPLLGVRPPDLQLRRIEADEVPFADTSDYAYGPITPTLAALLPESDEKRRIMKRTLQNAGYYNPHAWHNLAATRYLAVIIPVIVFGALLVMAPPQLEWVIIGSIVAVPILGYSIPSIVVQSKAANRLKEIEQAMPDMLDMLNMCVSQGMTLPASLARVAKELRGVYPAMAQELQIVAEQARISSLSHALENFSERVDIPDVHSLASLLIQTEKMGTSVSAALSDYADNMRETLRQRADQKANAASFKLLFPTVLCLMPAVFLFLLGPAIVQLNDFFSSGGSDLLQYSTQNAQDALE